MTDPAAAPSRVHDETEEHDLGLQHDLPRLARAGLGRRGLLGIAGGLGIAALAGCASSQGSSSPESSSPSGGSSPVVADQSGSGVTVAAGEIPEETAGPFPGDGSNGPNVLTESGVVRRDLTRSFGSASGVADGVPLTLKLRVYDLNGSDATPLAGAAVYVWHCDREGNYSLYSEAAADQNYLRAAATSASAKLRTSQLAFPREVCEAVYAEEGYDASVGNLAAIGLETDMVFADGYSLQMASMSGSVAEGYVATLNVPV